MSHEPKLEIYKLVLFKKENNKPINFREFFRNKFADYHGMPRPVRAADIFKKFHTEFIKTIDLKGYKLNPKKNKAFTIAYDVIDGVKKSHISSPLVNNFTINGILEGGKHGVKRWLGKIDDTNTKSPITTNNIVNDRFYFLIHAPLDHSEAIVMIQGYTESKISDVFRDHLVQYFQYLKEIKSRPEIFVPIKLKEKYLEKATFKSLKFSSEWIVKPEFNDIQQKDYEIEIKIEIIDKSQKKVKYKGFKDLLKIFGKSTFQPEGGAEKKLEDFGKKHAKMNSQGKDFPIDFDDEDHIKPVILLRNEGITVGKDEVPSFDEIDIYCKKLLKDILDEILPENAVKEL